jgi:hypothetical protein
MAWLGAMPQGMMQPYTGQQQTMSDPFVWGAGGARMRPEDIARQREMAAQMQMAGADTSPVGHWTQGLARVAQALGGHVREKQANKAAEGLSARDAAIAEALLGGGSDVAMRAMLDPYASQGTRGAAKMIWEQANQKPPAPTEFERMLTASGVQPGTPEWAQAMGKAVTSRIDPEIVVPLPQGVYVGPRSGLADVMKGGGPASSGSVGGSPPSTLPPDFDFGEKPGGPTPRASGGFPR